MKSVLNFKHCEGHYITRKVIFSDSVCIASQDCVSVMHT